MVIIPTGMRYTATVSGEKIKYVECAHCSAKYVYIMRARATGQGRSALFLDNDGAKRRAAQNAEQSLRGQFEKSCIPVCCPSCGRYQSNMVSVLKSKKYNWLIVAGVLAGPAAGVVTIIYFEGDRSQHNLVYVQSAFLFLCVLSAEDRVTAGKSRAEGGFPLDEFQQILSESRMRRVESPTAAGPA